MCVRLCPPLATLTCIGIMFLSRLGIHLFIWLLLKMLLQIGTKCQDGGNCLVKPGLKRISSRTPLNGWYVVNIWFENYVSNIEFQCVYDMFPLHFVKCLNSGFEYSPFSFEKFWYISERIDNLDLEIDLNFLRQWGWMQRIVFIVVSAETIAKYLTF